MGRESVNPAFLGLFFAGLATGIVLEKLIRWMIERWQP